MMNDDKTVTLTYDNGDVCSSDNGKKWKTMIKFVCERGSKVIGCFFLFHSFSILPCFFDDFIMIDSKI